jgi:hypothetical protein
MDDLRKTALIFRRYTEKERRDLEFNLLVFRCLLGRYLDKIRDINQLALFFYGATIFSPPNLPHIEIIDEETRMIDKFAITLTGIITALIPCDYIYSLFASR